MKVIPFRREQTEKEIQDSIQEAIDEAWELSRSDPAMKAHWDQLFPDGKKPSREEFINRLALELHTREAMSNNPFMH